MASKCSVSHFDTMNAINTLSRSASAIEHHPFQDVLMKISVKVKCYVTIEEKSIPLSSVVKPT